MAPKCIDGNAEELGCDTASITHPSTPPAHVVRVAQGPGIWSRCFELRACGGGAFGDTRSRALFVMGMDGSAPTPAGVVWWSRLFRFGRQPTGFSRLLTS